MGIITIKNWYQLDFSLPDASLAKDILLDIDEVMSDLILQNLAEMWFFLYEGDSVRVRVKSNNPKQLEKRLIDLTAKSDLEFSDKLKFSKYEESDESLFNEKTAEGFAKIMCEATTMTIDKLKGNTDFDNYRVLERLQHCLFNIMLTLGFKPEEHFLIQRLYERTGKTSDKDFENKI